MRNKYIESFEKTSDGWFGDLKYGYITDNQEITITGDTKEEVLQQQYRVRKATKEECLEIWGY